MESSAAGGDMSQSGRLTHVTLKFAGEVWTRMQMGHLDFAFEGQTLGELLQCLVSRYPLRDLIFDAYGQLDRRFRVILNGRFSYLVGGMDAPVHEGDMVVVMGPYHTMYEEEAWRQLG